MKRLFTFKHQSGFGIIDSIVALALLATLIVGINQFSKTIILKNQAKQLAEQTNSFADAFARYIHGHFDDINKAADSGLLIITPDVVKNDSGKYWPDDLATQNFLKQIPCTIIAKNPVSGQLEALLLYVGGVTQNADDVRLYQAAASLGGNGGIFANGQVKGNFGWSIDSGANFLISATQCGASIADNSLAINLTTKPQLDLVMQPAAAINKAQYSPSNNDSLDLPGHALNTNTPKANLYLAANKGVVFDSTKNIKLSVQDDGSNSKSPVIGLGQNTTSVVADTFQSNQIGHAGDPCQSQEVGKTIGDGGNTNANLTAVMARNTLVCSQNNILCGNNNYCYLPTITNKIIYQNTDVGVQDRNNTFICPTEVPFAIAETHTVKYSQNNVYMFADVFNTANPIADNISTPNLVAFKIGHEDNSVEWKDSGKYLLKTDFVSVRDRPELLGINFNTIRNNPVATINTASYAETTVKKSLPTAEGYFIPIGYTVTLKNGVLSSCDNICGQLDTVLENHIPWVSLGTRRYRRSGLPLEIIGTGCGCERTDYLGDAEDNYSGIAAVQLANPKAILTSVTCSNMPVYSN